MRIEALVKPELLLWARESAGLSREEAAKKAQVKPERLASWELGERRPTINQLRKLASAYKRPLAVFYLPQAPKDFQAMHDYRRLPGKVAGLESPELRLEIRNARYRRQVALDLFAALGEKPPRFSPTASLTEDQEGLAQKARQMLRLTYEEQAGWQTARAAFTAWRNALEQLGVFVFQARGIEVTEMRGFSLAEPTLPAVVVNIKDHPHGRIFTMVHEFVHLMLRREGLCDLVEDSPRPPEDQRVEVFCNRVAGAILMPKDRLLSEALVLRQDNPAGWSADEITQLASRYRVSSEALLRRLLVLEKTTEDFYRQKRKQLHDEFEEKVRQRRKQEKRGPRPDRLAVSTSGRAFVRLVLDSFYQEKITSSDVSDYLDVRLKWLPEIEKAVFGRPQGIWAFA